MLSDGQRIEDVKYQIRTSFIRITATLQGGYVIGEFWRAAFPRQVATIPGNLALVGRRAHDRMCRIAMMGPRHPNSEGHRQLQEYITSELQPLGCDVEHVEFVARTPIGPLKMTNIIARFSCSRNKVAILSGHYDTIRPECVRPLGRRGRLMKLYRTVLGRQHFPRATPAFVGANDGGSSTALLLEMAVLRSEMPELSDVWIVFFDGEEAVVEWNESDNTYGSRHQVECWRNDGTLDRIAALVNIDMIGDENFAALYETNSTPWLRDEVFRLAERLGYEMCFPTGAGRGIGDDHLPFARAGVPAMDIIDADYGPNNCYWHTLEDSPDKLSPQSFAVVAHVLSELLRSNIPRR